MKQLKIKLVKSTIGTHKKHKANVWSLGLRKIGREKIFSDTPQVRGQIALSQHLLKVEEIGS